jgi:tRNA1Val (adenine37-N6)-methyltransferase
VKEQRTPFRFKQFSVADDQCSMKVGTDAVLLGAWADLQGAQHLLDIGSGSGIITLMLAQRSSANSKIEGIEIAEPDFLQACENVNRSPWSQKILLHHAAVQSFRPASAFDFIICNPPFFENSLPPPDPGRNRARHTQALSFIDLLKAVKSWLLPSGKFCLILPTGEGDRFAELALDFGLHCNRRLAFFTRMENPQERWLMEFSFLKKSTATERMVLHGQNNLKSQEYRKLTHDFYLN